RRSLSAGKVVFGGCIALVLTCAHPTSRAPDARHRGGGEQRERSGLRNDAGGSEEFDAEPGRIEGIAVSVHGELERVQARIESLAVCNGKREERCVVEAAARKISGIEAVEEN